MGDHWNNQITKQFDVFSNLFIVCISFLYFPCFMNRHVCIMFCKDPSIFPTETYDNSWSLVLFVVVKLRTWKKSPWWDRLQLSSRNDCKGSLRQCNKMVNWSTRHLTSFRGIKISNPVSPINTESDFTKCSALVTLCLTKISTHMRWVTIKRNSKESYFYYLLKLSSNECRRLYCYYPKRFSCFALIRTLVSM